MEPPMTYAPAAAAADESAAVEGCSDGSMPLREAGMGSAYEGK